MCIVDGTPGNEVGERFTLPVVNAQSCPNFPSLFFASWLCLRDALFEGYEKWLRASNYAVGLKHSRVAVTSSPAAAELACARRTVDDFCEVVPQMAARPQFGASCF